ncbi:hypothetical protein M409DRAFT_60672 [Zasmidium cellare ATCC 36951]|uniref:Azaphilone pigments biosynthesis cluster protein L N-terminal domain-containing protein n=1 Tax=Zasmidium cellare ATCC 36951 TaxID=1080233 RepID=A0A6A6BYC1_ZASCE|nr:uncharacterized protein M409DRAFT_60672 [Zasmidium cellare ATCC 36951]KAF2159603.1 hypothetical protein M409DRAFT_60672 [Zasmidium cellare ATCC 36951]
MEPLSAGASVLTFVAIALDGASKLSQAVAAYRGGPQEVQYLGDSINELQAILRQLSEILQDAALLLPPEFATALENSLRSCQKRLVGFTAELKKCEASSQDRVWPRVASRLRPVLHQKDLEKMRLAILKHLAALSLDVGLINDFRTAAIGEAVQTVDRRLERSMSLQQQQADGMADLQASWSIIALSNCQALQGIENNLAGLPTWFTQQLQALKRHFDLRFDTIPLSVSPIPMISKTPLHSSQFVPPCVSCSGSEGHVDAAFDTLLDHRRTQMRASAFRIALSALEYDFDTKPLKSSSMAFQCFGHPKLLQMIEDQQSENTANSQMSTLPSRLGSRRQRYSRAMPGKASGSEDADTPWMPTAASRSRTSYFTSQTTYQNDGNCGCDQCSRRTLPTNIAMMTHIPPRILEFRESSICKSGFLVSHEPSRQWFGQYELNARLRTRTPWSPQNTSGVIYLLIVGCWCGANASDGSLPWYWGISHSQRPHSLTFGSMQHHTIRL